MVQELWREDSSLHINIKELKAAIDTVLALANPGDRVNLSVDNTVAYRYLKKQGGRKTTFNKILKPLVTYCQRNNSPPVSSIKGLSSRPHQQMASGQGGITG